MLPVVLRVQGTTPDQADYRSESPLPFAVEWTGFAPVDSFWSEPSSEQPGKRRLTFPPP